MTLNVEVNSIQFKATQFGTFWMTKCPALNIICFFRVYGSFNIKIISIDANFEHFFHKLVLNIWFISFHIINIICILLQYIIYTIIYYSSLICFSRFNVAISWAAINSKTKLILMWFSWYGYTKYYCWFYEFGRKYTWHCSLFWLKDPPLGEMNDSSKASLITFFYLRRQENLTINAALR